MAPGSRMVPGITGIILSSGLESQPFLEQRAVIQHLTDDIIEVVGGICYNLDAPGDGGDCQLRRFLYGLAVDLHGEGFGAGQMNGGDIVDAELALMEIEAGQQLAGSTHRV